MVSPSLKPSVRRSPEYFMVAGCVQYDAYENYNTYKIYKSPEYAVFGGRPCKTEFASIRSVAFKEPRPKSLFSSRKVQSPSLPHSRITSSYSAELRLCFSTTVRDSLVIWICWPR